MATLAPGSECAKAMDTFAQGLAMSTGTLPYTISIQFECEFGSNLTSALWSFGTAAESTANAAILRMGMGDGNGITFSSHDDSVLTWLWKRDGFADGDICNGEYHTLTARRDYGTNERFLIFDGGVRARDVLELTQADTATNFCAGHTSIVVESPTYTPYFCRLDEPENCSPQMHALSGYGRAVALAQSPDVDTHVDSYIGSSVEAETLIFGGDFGRQRYMEFLELYRSPDVKSAFFCAWRGQGSNELQGVTTSESFVQVSRDGTTWKTIMQMHPTDCKVLSFPDTESQRASSADSLDLQCTTPASGIASYENCVDGRMSLRSNKAYEAGDIRVRVPKEYQPFRFFRLKLGSRDTSEKRYMAFGSILAVPEQTRPFPGRLRNLRIWGEGLGDECLDEAGIINIDRPAGFTPTHQPQAAAPEHSYTGRRALSETDTDDLGVEVSCDVDVQIDAGRDAATELNRRDYEASDSNACQVDCEKQPLCNYWDWVQTAANGGRCILYSSSNHTIARPGGPYQVDSLTTVANARWTTGLCAPMRHATDFVHPGVVEIWVSRSLALFGTRAAVVDTTKLTEGEATVYLNEDEGSAEGRYVYLRSFDSGRRLSVDGLRVYQSQQTQRRLLAAKQTVQETGVRLAAEAAVKAAPDLSEKDSEPRQEEAQPEAPEAPEPPDEGSADTKDQPDLDELPPQEDKQPKPLDFSWERVWHMRNLTSFVCTNESSMPQQAREARQLASMFWANLREDESEVGCVSCYSGQPTNCTVWFKMPHGDRFAGSAEFERLRAQMEEQLNQDAPQRREQIEQAMSQSCCRTHKKTGKRECGKEYCVKAFKNRTNQRMAHVLRKLHESPKDPSELSVQQLVATDMLAPHLHSFLGCQSEVARGTTGELECVARSLTKHVAEKHGFSEDELNRRLDRYGTTVADLMTMHLKHSSGKAKAETKERKKSYASDPDVAEAAAAARREQKAERARRGLYESVPAKKKAARASWIRRSLKPKRRRVSSGLDAPPDPAFQAPGVEPLALSGTELRARKKAHDQFVRNQSCAAKDILKAANLAAAKTGGEAPTVTNLMSGAWQAALATDGSLIGRARSVLGGVGRAAERFADMQNILSTARANAPPPPPPKVRRTLSEREEAYFQKVDDLVGAVGRGFKVPDHIDEHWGWVSDAADWNYWWGETHRVGRILYDRHAWVQRHADLTGELPVGELASEHKTGYSFLDINAPPSFLGTWARSKFTGGDKHAPHRRLHETRQLHELPRADPPEHVQRRSLIGSFLDASLEGEDPIDAAWHALHYNNHQTRTRRLAELSQWMTTGVVDTVYDYGASLAPIVFGEATGVVPDDSGESNGIQQITRYLAYDTLLCYLYPPPSIAGGPFGDGTPITLHYSNRACFPMIPVLPPDMSTFNEALNLSPEFKFESLEYENACDTSTVRSLISPVLGDLSTIGFIKAPYGSMLRIAEGIDSIRNFAAADAANSTDTERASAVVCGLSQLGGVIWMAIVVVFLGAACVCAPVGSWCCLSCYRGCTRRSSREAKREAALDRLLAREEPEPPPPQPSQPLQIVTPVPLQPPPAAPKTAPNLARSEGGSSRESQRLLAEDV